MKNIDRDILRIAIPSIIANITTPLLGLIDMAIVGHMGSPIYIAAIAVGSTIFSMIYWVFAFLRMGTSGMTAQAYGAGDRKERDASLYRAMSVAICVSILLIAFQSPIRSIMLHFFGSDVATSALASQYFDILIYGAPAALGLSVVNGWMIGVQNSKLTMWTSLIINISNIIASLLFVYVAKLGISGVALGTLLAQWVGFCAGCLMLRSYRPHFTRFNVLFNTKKIKRFFSINIDIFLRTLCLVAVTIWFTRASARQGDIVLAVNALLMQFFILFSYMMDGFAFAAEALVGKLTGAGQDAAKKEMIKRLFIVGSIVTLIFTSIYAISGDGILSLLSSDKTVIAMSDNYIVWAIFIPVAGVAAFIWDGIFIGETRTRQMLLSMLIAMALFFTIYFLLYSQLGNHALWLAFIAYLSTRGIVQTMLYFIKK